MPFFFLLILLKTRDFIGPVFNFFLKYFLKAFLVLRFYKKLVVKASSRDIDLLNFKSSLLALGILLLNRNKLYSIFIFKPLTSLKSNNKDARVIGLKVDFSSLVLMVKANTKSL